LKLPDSAVSAFAEVEAAALDELVEEAGVAAGVVVETVMLGSFRR
jgi:hypothetical protein